MQSQDHQKKLKNLFVHNAKKKFNLKNKQFDLVISLGCVHNLEYM